MMRFGMHGQAVLQRLFHRAPRAAGIQGREASEYLMPRNKTGAQSALLMGSFARDVAVCCMSQHDRLLQRQSVVPPLHQHV